MPEFNDLVESLSAKSRPSIKNSSAKTGAAIEVRLLGGPEEEVKSSLGWRSLFRCPCDVLVCIHVGKSSHLRFRKHRADRPHGHVHVIGARTLREGLKLLLNIEFILFGQRGRADAIAAGTVASGTSRDPAFRIASVDQPLHGIAVAVTAVLAQGTFAVVFRQPGQ